MKTRKKKISDSQSLVSKLNRVTRVEIIDETGRAYVNCAVTGLDFSFQDDDKTLKLFITTDGSLVLQNRMAALDELTELSQRMGLYDSK